MQQWQPRNRRSNHAAAPPAWAVKVEPLDVPAGASSMAPQLTASNRGVLVSWLEQADPEFVLKFAERANGAWSAPQKIASDKNWFVSAADVPTVLRLSDGTLVANWYPAVDFRLEAYDIRLSYSKDDGKTWARPLVPHHDKTRTQHGFVSLFEMPAGGLGLVWLDGRNQGKQPEDAEMAMYFASYRHGMEADRRSVRQRARLRVLHDVSRGHTRRRRRGVPRSQREGDP